MFAYLIIAAELAFLYTVFWYIFLREPKPYRIKGEMWGRYESNALARYFESLEQETNASSVYGSSEYEWLNRIEGVNKNKLQTVAISRPVCPQLQGASAHRGYCAPQQAKKYGWVVDEPNRLDGNPLKFVIEMAEKLGNLSSRRP